MTIVEAARGLTGGVDTHLDIHVAAALDPLGGLLGTERFRDRRGRLKALLAWLATFGDVTKIGIEGTGSYGSGLTRCCVDRHRGHRGHRPNREERRRSGKSDPLDAVEAARAALSGRANGRAKSGRCRRGDPSARRGQALGPPSPRQGPHPDAPPRLHRPEQLRWPQRAVGAGPRR